MGDALGNVRSYEFGDYEVVYYCVIHSRWKVGGERGCFFFILYVESLGEGRKRKFAMIRVW